MPNNRRMMPAPMHAKAASNEDRITICTDARMQMVTTMASLRITPVANHAAERKPRCKLVCTNVINAGPMLTTTERNTPITMAQNKKLNDPIRLNSGILSKITGEFSITAYALSPFTYSSHISKRLPFSTRGNLVAPPHLPIFCSMNS